MSQNTTNNGITHTTLTIPTDSVQTIQNVLNNAVILVQIKDSSITADIDSFMIASYILVPTLGAAPTADRIIGVTNIKMAVVNTILTGTTGILGDVTASISNTNNVLYIENRLGHNIIVQVSFPLLSH